MTMPRNAMLLSICLALGAAAAPRAGHAAVGVDITIAPPAPRVEVLPPPRPGFVWAPGFWDYRGRAQVWVPGRWIPGRRGYHWVPDVWVQRGPRWHHQRGHWAR